MGEVINDDTITTVQRIINSLSASEYHVVEFTVDGIIYKALNAKVKLAKDGVSKIIHGVTSEYLSQKWLISMEVDSRTVQHATQIRIRTIMHPYL